jgi:hypothetical protein
MPMYAHVFNRSQPNAASPEETGTVECGTTTATAAATTAASAAVTAPSAAASAAVSAITGSTPLSSVEPRKPRQEIVTSGPSADQPQRRYKKVLSAKSVLSGQHQAAASRELSLRSSPPIAARPTTDSTLLAKVRTAAAKQSAEKKKRVAETAPLLPAKKQKTAPIPAKKQKTAPDRTSAETAPLLPAKKQKTSPIPTKKQKTAPVSTSNAKSKSPASTSKKRGHPHEIFSGPPDEPIEGGWPAGWKKTVVQRQSGATKGGSDRYWYTPDLGHKLRSMLEVKRFMAALAAANGDEKEAWGVFKSR